MYEIKSKEIDEIFNTLNYKYGITSVFEDFVKMFAIALYNAIAKNETMEKEYINTINQYQKEDQLLFPKLAGELINEYENSHDIVDVLGVLFEKYKLGNSRLGQFFTPSHISDFMAKMIVGNKEKLNNSISERGFISICEPTCGAGGMVLSAAKVIRDNGYNYQQQILVEATDISPTCAYMAYIQFALYGIPAVVYCGDCLSQKFNFKMETPSFLLQFWKFSSFYNQNSEEKEQELQQSENKISINITENKDVTVLENGQITLW